MARELMTLRLDTAVRRRLGSAARRSGRTASELARSALEAYLDREDGRQEAPYELVRDLVGCVRGGDPRRSTRGARGIAAALKKRAATRGPRR